MTTSYRLVRSTPEAAVLMLIAAATWTTVVWLAARMGSTPGSMGLGPAAFVGVWSLMMAAMMLPATAPVAAAFARSFRVHRAWRLAAFACGYLLVWTCSGFLAFAGAVGIDHLSAFSGATARALAACTLLAAAVYQLTPLKSACLRHCRSPLAQLLRYAAFRGPLRNLRVGMHHGSFCLGCCCMLMLLLIALGTMNVFLMLGLTALVVLEKLSVHGILVSRLFALAALALAVVAIAVPQAGLGVPAISA